MADSDASPHTAAFWIQADALLRKNLTYQVCTRIEIYIHFPLSKTNKYSVFVSKNRKSHQVNGCDGIFTFCFILNAWLIK